MSPTVVLNSRYGFIRHQFAIARYGDGFDPTVLGFPAPLVSQLPRRFFPQVRMSDYTMFGNTGSQFTYSDTHSWSETVNKVLRAHSLKFGTEFRVMRNNQQNPTSSFGEFFFDKGFTQRDPLQGDAASGNAFASLLLGYPASASVPYNVAPAYQNTYWVLFVQDDWRFPNIRTRRPALADFSLFKAFQLHEGLRLQFRAESFNLLNTPWFGAPNTSLDSSNFGVVAPSQANDPRNVQLALKLVF